MMKIVRFIIFVFVAFISSTYSNAASINNEFDIVVAQDGTGDFASVYDAIEALPMYCYQRVTILVKNGVYNEKFKIDRDYITLIGEDREKTRIEYNILRQDWIDNKDDIGPAVVNIYADDIILSNLTIENTQPQIGPHAFAIYGTGTRTLLTSCTVLSKGGDTVSLWDYKTGMYYHNNCYFQGAVDFVCPRGWCYISNSTFYELKNTAAVWHAAPTNPQQKFVLNNCKFQGADSFYLARHHYDAQFYFLNCTFPQIMMDKSIEHVVYKDKPEKNRPYLYGNRYFFFNCHRESGNFSWFANNTDAWLNNVTPELITPEWTFDGKWNPLDTSEIEVKNIEIDGDSLKLWFSELVMVTSDLSIKSSSGNAYKYYNGSGSFCLILKRDKQVEKEELTSKYLIEKGKVQNIQATVNVRYLSAEINK